jgi:hypothetical protein
MEGHDFARWQDDESGWDGEPRGPLRPVPPDPRTGRRSDERVLRDILESLAENEAIRSGEIDIVVRDGEVTLTGTVADRATRKQAETCVAAVFGVRDVTNQLRIEFSPEVQDEERRS